MKRVIPLFIISVVALTACHLPPELPHVPKIRFQDVYFIDNPTVGAFDTLVFEIYFEDGDGDLGLTSDMVYPPFHPYDYRLDSFGDPIKYGSDPNLPPFNTNEYVVELRSDGTRDTFRVDFNEDYYNFFIKMYERTSTNDDFTQVDTRAVFNTNINGRLPFLSKEMNKNNTLEGVIKYKWQSAGWMARYSLKQLYFEIQIQDRSLKRSNTIRTPEFYLRDIAR